jgi:N-acetylneuraminate synthase
MNKLYFIADIASNHDQDFDRAINLIKLAKKSGANCVKFQHFKADTIASENGFKQVGGLSHQAKWKDVKNVFKKNELLLEWIPKLKEYCERVRIDFMITPYDIDSIDYINNYVDSWKIGSGDITYKDLILKILKTKKPVFISIGATHNIEFNRLYAFCEKHKKAPVFYMQCNTNYTNSIDNIKYVNLNVIKEYNKISVIGLSDHTKSQQIIDCAVALGANVFERHFTDGASISPDNEFSLMPFEFFSMIQKAKLALQILGDGKIKVEENESDTFIIQRRAMYLKHDMKKGEMVNEKDLIALRPFLKGSVTPFDFYLGKILINDVYKDCALKKEDLCNVN